MGRSHKLKVKPECCFLTMRPLYAQCMGCPTKVKVGYYCPSCNKIILEVTPEKRQQLLDSKTSIKKKIRVDKNEYYKGGK